MEHNPLQMRESRERGVYVPDLTERTIQSLDDFQTWHNFAKRISEVCPNRITPIEAVTSFVYRVILKNIPSERSRHLPTIIHFAVLPGE
jgi:hypothetical protein